MNGTNGFKLNGVSANDRCGIRVSAAGDFNNDGYADLMAIADQAPASPGPNQRGRTSVVYGGSNVAPGGTFELNTLNNANGFEIDGYFGNLRTLGSGHGDFNNDTLADLLIATELNDNSKGQSYVLFGSQNAPSTSSCGGIACFELPDAMNQGNGLIINGINDRDLATVRDAGDFNGDGCDDLVISARAADPNQAGAGQTYVVFGCNGAGNAFGIFDLFSDLQDSANGLIINGFEKSSESGYSTSFLGDFNGDGKSDLIIGAHQADPNGVNSGQAYIVYGVNDVPTLLTNRLTINQGQNQTINNANLKATDIDYVDSNLVFIISSISHGQFLFFNDVSGPITRFTQADIDNSNVFFATDNSAVPPSYLVSVTDGVSNSVPQAATVTFTPNVVVPNKPSLNQPIPIPEPFRNGKLWTLQIPSNTFIESGQVLTINVTLANGNPLPDWLKFTPTLRSTRAGGGVLSGIPPKGTIGTLNLKITATNLQGGSVSQEVSLRVTDNHSPQVANAVSAQTAKVNEDFKFVVSDTAFIDVDGDPLFYSAQLVGGGPTELVEFRSKYADFLWYARSRGYRFL